MVMDSLDAAEQVLIKTAEPLHYQELTDLILGQDLWETEGKTPDASINARLAVDIKKHGALSRFMRTGPGVFALREWGLEEYFVQRKASVPTRPTGTEKLSFTDAAELILDSAEENRPLHYREITDLILELDLVVTEGLTPEATLYSLILTEIRRKTERGDRPRFVKYGQGLVGLRKWMG